MKCTIAVFTGISLLLLGEDSKICCVWGRQRNSKLFVALREQVSNKVFALDKSNELQEI